MPKIFLIKNRLLQQQQRLLETSKDLTSDDAEADHGSSYSHPSFVDSIRNSLPDSDEPLSLVVKKGEIIILRFFAFNFWLRWIQIW